VKITIEKLIYGGEGLARVPAEGDERRGKTVFVPYVCAGEVVEVSPVEERKGFVRASLVQVLEAAPERVAPECPHFGRCGGCQYQHISYPAQLEAKQQILRETVLRGAKLELPEIHVHAAEPWGYRNRIRLKVATGAEFAVGYHRAGSHELEPVRHCPIASPLLNRGLALLWELAAEAAAYESLREVQLFANHDDSELLVMLSVHHTATPSELRPLARLLRNQMPEIAGVVIVAGGASAEEMEDGSLEAAHKQLRTAAAAVEGEASLRYKVGAHNYKVSAGSFFQTNRFLALKLVELATGGAQGKAALDLYAGVGLFTLPLSRNFERTTCVEIAPSSAEDLVANVASPHIRCQRMSTEDFLAMGRGRWDFCIVDPPRAGLGERTAKALAALRLPHIRYVSCDPATLSRDLAVLLAAGYRVEEAHLLDLFPQSYHMESILYLAR
jgi:23S rRNA (uracil1939-C5)-methyltransferase